MIDLSSLKIAGQQCLTVMNEDKRLSHACLHPQAYYTHMVHRPVLIVDNAFQHRYVLYNRRPKITTPTGFELQLH